MKYQVKDYPICDAISCMSGNSGLTEEFIYSTTQIKGKRYIVLSSAIEEETMMGEVPMCILNDKPIKIFENKEGLLVARNGRAGTTRYLTPGRYTINDHAYILSVKKGCPFKIDLRWLAIQYKTEFLSYSSASDNGTWNKTGFFKNVTIDIPDIDEQIRIVTMVEKAQQTIEKIKIIKKNLLKTFERIISVEYSKYVKRNISINDVLDCMSGNSGLTSEFIYSTLHMPGKRFKVLSGATQEENLLGEIPKCTIDDKMIKTFEDKEGLLVVRKGKAGATKFLPKGNYTINDDAYILSVKPDFEKLVDIRWIKIHCKTDFMNYSSSSDNGTWNKTGFFKNVTIDIPALEEQKRVATTYEKAEKYFEKIQKIEKQLTELLDKRLCSEL